MSNKLEKLQVEPFVINYLTLLKAVGVVGIALPILLAVGRWFIDGPMIMNSISAYYYSSMRDVMVGSLCAIGIFLLSYKGYERQDNLLSSLAGICAACTAIFPTAPKINPTHAQIILRSLHMVFGGGFLLSLAYFSLVLFRKQGNNPTSRKLVRNKVYLISGLLIVVCLVGIAGEFMLPKASALHDYGLVFWFEAVAIWAFGWAWFTKGGAILKDIV